MKEEKFGVVFCDVLFYVSHFTLTLVELIYAFTEEDEDTDRMTAPVFYTESPSWSNITNQTDQTCDRSEDFKYWAYTITYSVVFPIGFVCNFVALFVFLYDKKKMTANTVFMTNMAISDVGFSLTLPLRLFYYHRGCNWDFPDWLCRWCVFSFYLNLYTSVLFLTGLSVLRYIAVVHSTHHKSLVTVYRARLACLAIWIFVSCLSSPFFMAGTIQQDNKLRCFDPGNDRSWNRIFTLNYLGVSFGFVIPFITILFCYSCIIRTLLASKKMFDREQHKSSMYLIAVVLTTFLLCFLPYHVVRTVHLHAKVSKKSCPVIEMWLKVLVVSLCMAASNSCFNPVLYYFAGKNFRNKIHNWSNRRKTISSFKSQHNYTPTAKQSLTKTRPDQTDSSQAQNKENGSTSELDNLSRQQKIDEMEMGNVETTECVLHCEC